MKIDKDTADVHAWGWAPTHTENKSDEADGTLPSIHNSSLDGGSVSFEPVTKSYKRPLNLVKLSNFKKQRI